MSISFPTTHRRTQLGQPLRARRCRCLHGPVVHDFECVMCGRLPAETIAETWAEQAARLRLGERHLGVSPFRQNGAERLLEPV